MVVCCGGSWVVEGVDGDSGDSWVVDCGGDGGVC